LASKADKAIKEGANSAKQLEAKGKETLAEGQKKGSDALAKISPKQLREKVSQTKEQADEAIADLELPMDLAEPTSKTRSTDPPAPSKGTKPPATKNSAPNPTESVSPIDDLPPVKTTDVSRLRDAQRPSPAGGLPKKKTDDEFRSLDLPADVEGSAPSSLTPSSGTRSGGGSVGSKPSRLQEELPKPLPDADQVGLPRGGAAGGGRGPVHPYFQRFLKEGSYFVRDGESLREIAFNLYQDEAKVSDILAANKDSLRSPNDLKPGMKLRLP
jgi:nucleoid-associated protein YgaU